MRKSNKYKKLIIRTRGIIRNARIPKSFSKKNNNVFSNEKHIIMQVIMQKEKKHYRDMPDFLELLRNEIGLKKIPHFTTMNKFALRIKPYWFELLIAQIIKAISSEMAAIDGTGFSLNHRSRYFCTIAGERKEFLQFNACAELKNKLITAVKIRRKRRHENADVNCLMRKSAKQLKINYFLADKAYDSEKNHELAEKYGARLIVPLRKNGEIPVRKTFGFHRKQLRRGFPKEIYKNRVIIEGVFSALKRRYGELVYAKKFISEKNELLCRVLAYDLGIIVNLPKIEIYFLQASGFLVSVKFINTKKLRILHTTSSNANILASDALCRS